MTPIAPSTGNAITLFKKSALSGLGRLRSPSERAGEITREEMENHVKNDYDEEMEDG